MFSGPQERWDAQEEGESALAAPRGVLWAWLDTQTWPSLTRLCPPGGSQLMSGGTLLAQASSTEHQRSWVRTLTPQGLSAPVGQPGARMDSHTEPETNRPMQMGLPAAAWAGPKASCPRKQPLLEATLSRHDTERRGGGPGKGLTRQGEADRAKT